MDTQEQKRSAFMQRLTPEEIANEFYVPEEYRINRYLLMPISVDRAFLLVFKPFKINICDRAEEHVFASVESPYAQEELSGIQHAQSHDVIFLAHSKHPPARLRRYADTTFVYEPLPQWPAENGCPAVCGFHQGTFYLAATDAQLMTFWRVDMDGMPLPFL